MKLTIIILFISASLIYSQSQSKLLERAYKINSKILLDEFLLNWQNEIKPITKEELEAQNDTVRTVYKIYDLVFNSVIYKNYHPANFLLLSNKIEYGFADFFYDHFWKKDSTANKLIREIDTSFVSKSDSISELWSEAFHEPIISMDSIMNFIPFVNNHESILYLNDFYLNTINYFLFKTSIKNNISDILKDTPFNSEQIVDRISFVKYQLPIGDPYRSGFEIGSEPGINSMMFGNDFNTAEVHFYLNCNIWKAYLIKQNDTWILLKLKEWMCVCG